MASATALHAQEEGKEKKGFKIKKPNLKLGEKIGDLAGNMMTAKTDDLSLVVLKSSMICGFYPPEIGTSESKYLPEGTVEGDYFVGVSLMKNEGMGMYKLLGEVTLDGEPLEYMGLGSYAAHFTEPITTPKTIEIKSETGQEASITLTPIAGVKILSVNGDVSLPVLDLDEDIVLEYENPEGVEDTRLRVSLISDVAGARALNHFGDFPSGKAGKNTITIPKESLANPEIVGQLNVGNFNKGENYFILEREVVTEPDQMGPEQKLDAVATAEIKVRAYDTKRCIVKGKQDDGLLFSLNVSGETAAGVGYEAYKPNANSGMPLSMMDNLGLISFTLTGDTYDQESDTRSSSWTVGGTRYTRTVTTTTTYQFPQLPSEQWQAMMDLAYNQVLAGLQSEFEMTSVPVSEITGTADYATLFPPKEKNTYKTISTTYGGTNRVNPESLGEIFGSVSSNMTSDVPLVRMMKESGTDALLTLKLDLYVAGNSDKKIVLLPYLSYAIEGRDENNANKAVTYANGVITRSTGNPFNGDLVALSPEALADACSLDLLVEGLLESLRVLQQKEIELGFERIWNLGSSSSEN